jgi:uncharacterized membrane protein YphA (DoxX/SURF4 family)
VISELLEAGFSLDNRPMNRASLPVWSRALRLSVGLLFVGTGVFKLVAPLSPELPAGPAGFAQFLEAAGIPFALANAYLVCIVEIAAGLGLALSSMLRPLLGPSLFMAAALALSMLTALVTVGLPAALGNPIRVGSTVIAGEPWRLALEAALLVLTGVMVLTTWRTLRRAKV